MKQKIDWANADDVLSLIRTLAYGNGHGKYDAYQALSDFDEVRFKKITGTKYSQLLATGIESRTIQTYLGSALIAAVRDFTDTNTGSDAACDGVEIAARVGEQSKGIRKAMRLQIRRTLDSPTWKQKSKKFILWKCPFCGTQVVNDLANSARRKHISEEHPNALPARNDVGCVFKWNRGFVRHHLLLLLAALIRKESWTYHQKYFVKTRAHRALQLRLAILRARRMPLKKCWKLLH